MSPSLPKTYKAAVWNKKEATSFELKDLPLKEPGKGQVLVKVLACGVCHTEDFERLGYLGNEFPRVPGHELVGDVVAVGENVTRFKGGERVGGPWHGGHDKSCVACQRGEFQMCDNEVINGVHFDGGYAEYVLLRDEAVVRVPADMDPAQVAPLLCAGVTTFNAMRKMHVEQGNLVAVQGLGGLGHLAVQYASRMGYTVAALSHGHDKAGFARQLGAHIYVDTSQEDVAQALQKRGGAAMICSTSPVADSISPLVHGLQARGKLIVLAPLGPVPFDTAVLVTKGASVHGFPSGHALDCEEAIDFANRHGVECMVEKFPLADVQKAYEHMLSGNARFRVVLVME